MPPPIILNSKKNSKIPDELFCNKTLKLHIKTTNNEKIQIKVKDTERDRFLTQILRDKGPTSEARTALSPATNASSKGLCSMVSSHGNPRWGEEVQVFHLEKRCR